MLRITLERERRGMTKAALARAASVDQGLMSKIESGRVRPYPGQLRRLAAALEWGGDQPEALLGEVSATVDSNQGDGGEAT